MKLQFDSNLPGLLDEVLSNQTCAILYQPINITKGILAELAQLATEIDDDRLHVLMLRLGLYDVPANKRVERIKELREQIATADVKNTVHYEVMWKNGTVRNWHGPVWKTDNEKLAVRFARNKSAEECANTKPTSYRVEKVDQRRTVIYAALREGLK